MPCRACSVVRSVRVNPVEAGGFTTTPYSVDFVYNFLFSSKHKDKVTRWVAQVTRSNMAVAVLNLLQRDFSRKNIKNKKKFDRLLRNIPCAVAPSISKL